MNKYVYIAVFRDPTIETFAEIPICFENEIIFAENEDQAYDLGNELLLGRIADGEEGYIKYKSQPLINDYVVKV